MNFEDKIERLERVARKLLELDPEWDIFYREIFGARGYVAKLFATAEELKRFEQSELYRLLMRDLKKLQTEAPLKIREPKRVLTIRVPKSLHESLSAQAKQRRCTLNHLCLTVLTGSFLNGSADSEAERVPTNPNDEGPMTSDE